MSRWAKLNLEVYVATIAGIIVALAAFSKIRDSLMWLILLPLILIALNFYLKSKKCKACQFPILRLNAKILGMGVWTFIVPKRCRNCGEPLR